MCEDLAQDHYHPRVPLRTEVLVQTAAAICTHFIISYIFTLCNHVRTTQKRSHSAQMPFLPASHISLLLPLPSVLLCSYSSILRYTVYCRIINFSSSPTMGCYLVGNICPFFPVIQGYYRATPQRFPSLMWLCKLLL
jgi:hypothetical protein